jgi:signal peptidase I
MSVSNIPPEETGAVSQPQESAPEEAQPSPAPQEIPETTGKKAKKGKKGKQKEGDQPEAPRKAGSSAYGWLQALVLALVILVLLFSFFGRVIGVSGHSMDNSLADGDLMFLQCIAYQPKQGDVVVLHKNFGEIDSPIVKRIIATGGQTVEIDYDTSTVYVDGEPLDEPYILEPMVRPGSAYMQQTYWEVPEGCVFVMGDNRNNSSDSRDERLGCVEEGLIIGQAKMVIYPLSNAGVVE